MLAGKKDRDRPNWRSKHDRTRERRGGEMDRRVGDPAATACGRYRYRYLDNPVYQYTADSQVGSANRPVRKHRRCVRTAAGAERDDGPAALYVSRAQQALSLSIDGQ